MESLSKREKEKRTHENKILAAAEKVFLLKGYEGASMDEIAKEAQFTKRTVYQHFANKDDLYFAVVLKGFQKLHAHVIAANRREQTGYDKLEVSCVSYYQFCRDNPGFARLMNYWGHVRIKSQEESRNKNELIQFNQTIFREIMDVIQAGKEDGSIQHELDSEQTALSLMFLVTGFYQQLTASGDQFMEFFSLDPDEFSQYTLGMVIRPLKRNRAISATRKGTSR